MKKKIAIDFMFEAFKDYLKMRNLADFTAELHIQSMQRFSWLLEIEIGDFTAIGVACGICMQTYKTKTCFSHTL